MLQIKNAKRRQNSHCLSHTKWDRTAVSRDRMWPQREGTFDLPDLHLSVSPALKVVAWGRTAALGLSGKVKWRKGSGGTRR